MRSRNNEKELASVWSHASLATEPIPLSDFHRFVTQIYLQITASGEEPIYFHDNTTDKPIIKEYTDLVWLETQKLALQQNSNQKKIILSQEIKEEISHLQKKHCLLSINPVEITSS